MKIRYSNGELFKDIKPLLSFKEKFQAEEIESAEARENRFAEYKGLPVGGAPPEGWIDFAEHALNFILDKDLAIGIVGSAIWDLIKHSFKTLKSRGKNNNEKISIITDLYESSKFHKSIYFVFYAYQTEEEIKNGIEMIPEVRKRLIELFEVAEISNDTLRLTFRGHWVIN